MFQDVVKPFHLHPLKQILKKHILEKNLSKYNERKKIIFLKMWGKVSIYF